MVYCRQVWLFPSFWHAFMTTFFWEGLGVFYGKREGKMERYQGDRQERV